MSIWRSLQTLEALNAANSGTARPAHIGGSSQVWNIDITNAAGQLVCISRLTMAVLRLAQFDT